MANQTNGRLRQTPSVATAKRGAPEGARPVQTTSLIDLLQNTTGNQAVNRLVEEGSPSPLATEVGIDGGSLAGAFTGQILARANSGTLAASTHEATQGDAGDFPEQSTEGDGGSSSASSMARAPAENAAGSQDSAEGSLAEGRALQRVPAAPPVAGQNPLSAVGPAAEKIQQAFQSDPVGRSGAVQQQLAEIPATLHEPLLAQLRPRLPEEQFLQIAGHVAAAGPGSREGTDDQNAPGPDESGPAPGTTTASAATPTNAPATGASGPAGTNPATSSNGTKAGGPDATATNPESANANGTEVSARLSELGEIATPPGDGAGGNGNAAGANGAAGQAGANSASPSDGKAGSNESPVETPPTANSPAPAETGNATGSQQPPTSAGGGVQSPANPATNSHAPTGNAAGGTASGAAPGGSAPHGGATAHGGGLGGGFVGQAGAAAGASTGGTAAAGDGIATARTSDLALVNTELAEHQRWGTAQATVGAAGSEQRGEFIAGQVGAGLLGGFEQGGIQGLTLGLVDTFSPIPGVGAIIGGVQSLHGLEAGWDHTKQAVAAFGQGSDVYETLANSIGAVSAIIEVVTNVLNVLNGVLGVIEVALWAITAGAAIAAVFTAGAAAGIAVAAGEAAEVVTDIKEAVGVASLALGAINSLILQPVILLFRAMHTFTSQADPRVVEAQGTGLQQSAGSVGGFLGGLAGAALAGGMSPENEEAPPPVASEEAEPIPPAPGEGPTVTFEEPPPAEGSGVGGGGEDLGTADTQVPSTEMPSTEMPPTEMPPTEMPPTEMPPTEPAGGGPGGPGDSGGPPSSQAPTERAPWNPDLENPQIPGPPGVPNIELPGDYGIETPQTPTEPSPYAPTEPAPPMESNPSSVGTADTQMPPTEMPPTEMPPTEMPPTEMPPTEPAEGGSGPPSGGGGEGEPPGSGGDDDNSAHNAAGFERLKAQLAQEEIMGAEPTGSALKGGSGDVRSNQVMESVPVLDENGQPVLNEDGTPRMRSRRVDGVRNVSMDVDVNHSAPIFEQPRIGESGQVFPLQNRDGSVSNLTQMPSTVNGREGIVEYIVDANGNLVHQQFIPGGQVTGTPGGRASPAPTQGSSYVEQTPLVGNDGQPILDENGRQYQDRTLTPFAPRPNDTSGGPTGQGGGPTDGSGGPPGSPPPSSGSPPVAPVGSGGGAVGGPPTAGAASPVNPVPSGGAAADRPSVIPDPAVFPPDRVEVSQGAPRPQPKSDFEAWMDRMNQIGPSEALNRINDLSFDPTQPEFNGTRATGPFQGAQGMPIEDPQTGQTIHKPEAFFRAPAPPPEGVTQPKRYGVRVGPRGAWLDATFENQAEAEAYARQIATDQEDAIRQRSALPRGWAPDASGKVWPGNPVDAVRVMEIDWETPEINSVVASQPEGSPGPGLPAVYQGGGPQTQIGQTARNNAKVVLEIPITNRSGGTAGGTSSPSPGGSVGPPGAAGAATAATTGAVTAAGNQGAAGSSEGPEMTEEADRASGEHGGHGGHAGHGSEGGSQQANVERVNPNYSPPPGTPQQLKQIQNEISQTLAERAAAEQAKAKMDLQVQHHQVNQGPAQQAVQGTQQALTATQAHEQDVAQRDAANQEQQQRQGQSQSTVGGYANRAAGLAVLSGPLAAFRGFTSLASHLPGDAGAAMGRMNADGERVQHAFDQMTVQMAEQATGLPLRQQELQSDRTRIQASGQQGKAAATDLQRAQQGAQTFEQANQVKIQQATAGKEQATREEARLGAQAQTKQALATTLAAQLQAWATEHKAAREKAIEKTKQQLQAQGKIVTGETTE